MALSKNEIVRNLVKKVYADHALDNPGYNLDQLLTKTAVSLGMSEREICDILYPYIKWRSIIDRPSTTNATIQQQQSYQTQTIKDMMQAFAGTWSLEQQKKTELGKINFKNEPDNKIKQAQNVISLPNDVKLCTYAYDDIKKIGFELLMDITDLQSDEGRKKITDALQALMEYILSLE